MDKISVIVPVYNVERYLERCMSSILNQTYKELEIILIDDGATDNSGKMCDSYLSDSRVRVIHKKNAGLGYARNSGIEIATGKYIMFVDSDDYIELNMIEHLYNDLLKHNADTCIGGFKRVYVNHTDTQKNSFSGEIFTNKEILDKVLVKMFGKSIIPDDYLEMSVWKILFSNDIIQKNYLRFPSEREFISEDIIFDIEYYNLAKCVYMSDNTGYCYCDNEGSLTTRYRSERFKLQVKLYEELVRRTKHLKIYDEAKQRMMTTLVAIARYSIKLEEKFSKENSKKVARDNVKNICSDNVLQIVLQSYDDSGVRFQSRLINWMIRRKRINCLIIVMRLKNIFNI